MGSPDSMTLPLATFFLIPLFALTTGILVCAPQGNIYMAPAAGGHDSVQSPAYPGSLANSTAQGVVCSVALQASDTNTPLWFTFLNARAAGIDVSDPSSGSQKSFYDVDTNKQIYSFLAESGNFMLNMSEQFATAWTAFDAFVATPGHTDNCPLEAQLIVLDNENVAFPLTSTFHDIAKTHLASPKCQWTCNLDSGKQLKFVLRFLDFEEGESLSMLIDNKNQILFTTPVKQGQEIVYYFNGSRFDFNYTSAGGKREEKGFFALLSPVMIGQQVREYSCTHRNGTGTILSNTNFTVGYGAYEKCSQDEVLLANQEMQVALHDSFVEQCCDRITLGLQNFTLPLTDQNYVVSASGSVVHFNWESDGSVQQAGFSLTYSIHDCVCADAKVMVKCNESVVVSVLPDPNSYYCSNMACTFNVVPNPDCPESYFMMSPFTYLRPNNVDSYVITVDGNVFLNATSIVPLYSVKLSNKSQIGMTFSSGPATVAILNQAQTAFTIVSAVAPPTFHKINLDQQRPSYVVPLNDLTLNVSLTICVPQGAKLQLFISDDPSNLLRYVWLYDSDDLRNYVSFHQTAQTGNSARRFDSVSGCFTLLRSQNVEIRVTALFRITQATTCSGDSVFSAGNGAPKPLSLAATSGPCELVVLASQSVGSLIQLSNARLEKAQENALVSVQPTGFNRTFLAFGATDLLLPLMFYSAAVSLWIPAGATVTINAESSSSPFFTNTFALPDSSIRRGVLASPDFGGLERAFVNQVSLYSVQFTQNVAINFSMSQFSISDGAAVGIVDGNNVTHPLQQKGETFEMNGKTFQLVYKEPQPTAGGVLIEYSVQTLTNSNPNIATIHTHALLMTAFVVLAQLFS